MMKNNQFTLEGFGSVEEILGAYIEGHLSEAENHQVAELIGKNEELSDLVSEVTDFTDYWYDDADATPDIDNFELPELEYSDGNLISIEGIDLNSKFDINNNLNNEDIMLETLEIDNESLGNSAHAAIYEANKHYGLEPVNIDFDPDTYQWEKDTCAIRSQEIVLRSFGVFVPQDELIAQAEANGWYSKGHGTPMSDVGNLLDLYNVPNHRVADANVFNLIDELGHGHKVIVGVDIHELYGNPFWQSIKETLVGKTPNHAMIVSGIDTSNPDKPMVTLTDPGTGKTLFECPYEKFLSAWDDSSCFMVATDKAAPLEYNT
ncbi:hypothetical protein, partial [Dysgonomonas capnocytophagoides]|uniref:hypothetical protein n=1 Tax=Dysgonomonas capnocytophagoides TaxID=45254 RepID=UPI002A819F2D